jgi:AcrR family transcriptional regulator
MAAPAPRRPAGEDHLRARPRQARSAARVEAILAAAEEVFEEVGYAKATTNLVAARAEVPIPTLYRWFPDKGAIALALCERYLDDLDALYAQVLSAGDDEPVAALVERVLGALEGFVAQRRAFSAIAATASGPASEGGAGERLRTGLAGHVAHLVERRVPDIGPDDRDEVSDAVVTVVNAFLIRAGDDPPGGRPRLFRQLADVVLAYVDAKFPPADDPVWDDPAPAVTPILPGRVVRPHPDPEGGNTSPPSDVS